MAIRGTYLVFKLDGESISESIDVSMKINAKNIDVTSQEDGIGSKFMPGLTKIGMAGRLFFGESMWDSLYGFMINGSEIAATLYLNGEEMFDGVCRLKKLGKQSKVSDSLISCSYAVIYYPITITAGGYTLLTESGVEITTETDVEITTE